MRRARNSVKPRWTYHVLSSNSEGLCHVTHLRWWLPGCFKKALHCLLSLFFVSISRPGRSSNMKVKTPYHGASRRRSENRLNICGTVAPAITGLSNPHMDLKWWFSKQSNALPSLNKDSNLHFVRIRTPHTYMAIGEGETLSCLQEF